jgi:hypothetical protein
VVLCLASAVLTEVLGRLWYDILEELHLDSAQGLTAEGDVEEYYRIGRCGCHLCLDKVRVVEIRLRCSRRQTCDRLCDFDVSCRDCTSLVDGKNELMCWCGV